MSSLREIIHENVREGELYQKLDRKWVRCFACGHCCEIPDEQPGVCKVRYNQGGTLYVPWGYVGCIQCDPIEKKPFFHAYPGSLAYIYPGNLPGQVGDWENTRCPNCRELLIERYGYLITGYHHSARLLPGLWRVYSWTMGCCVLPTDYRPSFRAAYAPARFVCAELVGSRTSSWLSMAKRHVAETDTSLLANPARTSSRVLM